MGKYSKVDIYGISRIINAPLRFAYEWCTDFRNDDPKFSGSKSKRTVHVKTDRLCVYTNKYSSEHGRKLGVNIVWLYPPSAWHLDYVGEEDDETGDYRLTRLGPRKTRLDMAFKEYWKIPKPPAKKEVLADTNRIWDNYIAALERDYRKSK